MPDDHYQEIRGIYIATVVVFCILSLIVIYGLFIYQRKRFEHKRQIIELQKQFNETLLLSQLEIQEHSFNIISQEIHDNVGQILSLAKIQLNIIASSEQINKNMILDVKENIVKVMTDLRDIAKGLSTSRIQIGNLYDLVLQEVERINRSGVIKGTVEVEGAEKEIKEQHRLILFRIIQEGLQNILKHSGGSYFAVQLNYFASAFEVKISDNGAGFDVSKLTNQGLGLGNIRSRATLINGGAEIKSGAGEGTTIVIKIPYA